MLDFSNKTELAFLGALAGVFVAVASDVPYFLAGATARDLLLLAYGDYAFDDGGRGYYTKGANLGASPPCINPDCEKSRKLS